MNRRNVIFKLEKRLIVLVVVSLLGVFCFCGCGIEDTQEPVVKEEGVGVEESIEVQQYTEEETLVEESTEEAIVEEEQVEELSDEEWFKSLNLTDARFMIFNNITGERKLLENGQQYTLLEGDELASWYPGEWKFIGLEPSVLRNNIEARFGCVFIDLNYDQIGDNSELTLHVQDADGNDVYATIYLSK